MGTLMVFSVLLFVHLVQPLKHDLNYLSNHQNWADAAFRFIEQLECNHQKMTSWSECWSLRRVPKSKMNFYVAQGNVNDKLAAFIPDGSLVGGLQQQHDAVIAIDPYPNANFGHLVLVFFVYTKSSTEECLGFADSIYTAASGHCLILAKKRKCYNNVVNGGQECDVNFLPSVFKNSSPNRRRKQLLRCPEDIRGYGPCRTLRAINSTLNLMCDPIHVNTHGCSSMFGTVHTRCRLFETCDQAVILTGGWNREASAPSHLRNTVNMYRMLRVNGFKKGNIKIFYANGLSKGFESYKERHSVYPAAKKVAMRYHINKMCSSAHCVDSLVLYLNGPAMNDGSILLWDVDADGLVGKYEKYTPAELREDLENCLARRIFLIVDSSYSGKFIEAFNSSHDHPNVQIFSSGRSNEYSWGQEFTNHWVNFKHIHTCVSQVQKASQKAVRNSNPDVWHDKSMGEIDTNIFGAPCNVYPPFSRKELQRNYLGCQIVPTKVWISEIYPRKS